jgi:hypothetical protein
VATSPTTHRFLQYFVDNGPPGSRTRDLASAAFVDPAPGEIRGLPPDFPRHCPPPDTDPAGYLPVANGDVAAHDGAS